MLNDKLIPTAHEVNERREQEPFASFAQAKRAVIRERIEMELYRDDITHDELRDILRILLTEGVV